MFLLQNQGIQYVEEEKVKDNEQNNASSLITDADTTGISSTSVGASLDAAAKNYLSCTVAKRVVYSGFNPSQLALW